MKKPYRFASIKDIVSLQLSLALAVLGNSNDSSAFRQYVSPSWMVLNQQQKT
jgi:hypothetical protein